jgi:thiamine-phosphate pyrophosphorylase
VIGGVTLVQLREKGATTKEFYQEGLKIRAYLEERNIPLIINDRIDIALALDAEGVHLGQEDMPIDVARKIVGPQKIIGASVFTLEEAKIAEAMGADYLGLSPLFVTETKPELTRQIGIENIPSLKEAVQIPVVGIGSMSQANAYETVKAGLDGVAVVSAICARQDPKAAAEAIKKEVLRAKKGL